MIDYFLSKIAPVTGKYFRPVALLCLGIFLLLSIGVVASVIIAELTFQSFWSSIGSVLDLIGLVWYTLLFGLLGFFSIISIREKCDEYEPWGTAFYILTFIVIIYLIYIFLK